MNPGLLHWAAEHLAEVAIGPLRFSPYCATGYAGRGIGALPPRHGCDYAALRYPGGFSI